MRETRVQSLGWKDLLEKEIATTPVFLPGKSHGWRSLVGYSPWDCKESDMTEKLLFLFFSGGSDSKESACNVGDLGGEDPLEEDMATHSSILAWRIPMDRGAWWATVHRFTKSQT